jgi:hypothetical protein
MKEKWMYLSELETSIHVQHVDQKILLATMQCLNQKNGLDIATLVGKFTRIQVTVEIYNILK